MWEIIADPENYGIEILEEGIGNNRVTFPVDDRKRWAEEIGNFATKLNGLAERSQKIQQLFLSDEPIVATPASLKTLKVVFFKINDALISAMDLADKIEKQIVKK